MFLAGNIKSIGSLFATEHVNRVLSEASFVQLQNGGLQLFRGANNSYEFVRRIAQKIVIFVQVRIFQESLLLSSQRAPLKIQFCLMPSPLGDDISRIVRLLLLSTLTIGTLDAVASGRDRMCPGSTARGVSYSICCL